MPELISIVQKQLSMIYGVCSDYSAADNTIYLFIRDKSRRDYSAALKHARTYISNRVQNILISIE